MAEYEPNPLQGALRQRRNRMNNYMASSLAPASANPDVVPPPPAPTQPTYQANLDGIGAPIQSEIGRTRSEGYGSAQDYTNTRMNQRNQLQNNLIGTVNQAMQSPYEIPFPPACSPSYRSIPDLSRYPCLPPTGLPPSNEAEDLR